jgi:imidazolonepropionase-like amidohydrolase
MLCTEWLDGTSLGGSMKKMLLMLLSALFACAPGGLDTSAPFAFVDVTVIPMTGAGPLAGQTVVVEDGRIVAVGPGAQVSVPSNARVVDGTDRYLIPGLIEMHTHTSKTRASALGLFVVHGVTTIRDQGSEHAEVARWREEIRAGERVGPRMLIAGPILESPQNIERMRRDPPENRVEPFERARVAVGSPEDARRIVDSLVALGIDHLKVRTVQDRETYLALNAAADRHGIRLVGHAIEDSPALLLSAGQDGLDHPFTAIADSPSRSERMAFWREFAARDVGFVPTLVSATQSVFQPLDYFQALVGDSADATHPLRPYVSEFLILDWREQAMEASPERRALFERVWPDWLEQVREMREAGVTVMAGSDVGVLNVFPGASLHEELRLFVEAVGMSPAEALASATRVPAEWLGLADSLGTIEQGKVADLVLLGSDPLEDITNTRDIEMVMVGGEPFARDDLDALLSAVAAMPDQTINDWIR